MQNPAPERLSAASIATSIVTRLHRYKALFLRRWWIPLLTPSPGFSSDMGNFQARMPSSRRVKMMLAGKLNLAQNAVDSENSNNFYGTQIQLMQSNEVRSGAEALVRATHPELQPVKVTLSVTQRLRTSIFELEAVGTSPDYTQAFLNAVMQKYLDEKKSMRADQGSHVTTAITEQLIQVEKDLRNGEDEMLEFQKEHNIGFIQEEGNSAAAYLVKLNQEYARLKTEYDLLSLLDLDQNLDRQQVAPQAPDPGTASQTDGAMPLADFGPEGEYLKARQNVQLLKAERDTLSRDLRPKHPKIIKLNDKIDQQEKLIALYRQDAVEKLDTRRKSIGKQRNIQ
jgi:uncharacterized protein involved in exopolysaccharide biosynthesis